MPSDSKRKHAATTAAADEVEVRVDVEAIVDGAEQKKGGGSSTLFVSNLPYTATSTDLTTHFSDIGPVRSSFVVLSSKPNPADPTAEPIKASKGVGYVTFAMRTDAERAIAELNGRGFGGSKRKLGVEWADRKREEGEEPIVREKKRRIATQTSISVDDGPSTSSAAAAGSSAGSDPLAIRTIVISNLPAGLNKATLWKKIRKLSYNLSPASLQFPLEGAAAPETTAEVVFPTPKEAIENAERMHASTYKDSLLSCVLKKRLEKVAAPGAEGAGGEISKSGRMIIRNLPWDTTEATLNRLFIPYGPIHAVTLPPPVVKEGAKPRARGFAFVHMLTRKDAERAMEGVNGTTVFGEDNAKAIVLEGEERKGGREVAVDWALSRDKWEKEKVEDTVAEPAEAGEDDEEAADEDTEDAASGSGENAEMDDGTIFAPASDGEGSEVEEEVATPALPPPSEQTTLFVRNLSFEVTEDQLRTLFRTFGPLRYARITMDKATNRSRGTGFVCFWKKEDAERAIEEASMLAAETGGSGANAIVVKDRTMAANPFTLNSVLTADPSSSLAQNMTLNGRVLDVNWAVTREQAGVLKEENDRRKEKVDKRNTYLMREGVIFANAPAASTLHPVELEKRLASFNSRKTLLSSNPSLYISKTRLSIRQLPLFCTDRVLKRLAIYAARQFDKEVKASEREGLDDDEKRDGTLSAAVAKQEGKEKKKGKAERDTIVIQAKVVRASDRVDPLTGLGKSKGYGFLELRTHQDALKVLRWANNNPEVETLMRDWFAAEVKDLVERTKKSVDEARLKELTGVGATEEEAKPKKPRKGKQRKVEESEDDELPKAAPSKITPPGQEDLGELEARLGRLKDKERELTGQMDGGRKVEMKKTLIVEFSIENVQVVQRRINRTPREPRPKRERDDESEGPRSRFKDKRRRTQDAPEEKPAPAPEPAEDPEKKRLGHLVGRKRAMKKGRN